MTLLDTLFCVIGALAVAAWLVDLWLKVSLWWLRRRLKRALEENQKVKAQIADLHKRADELRRRLP